MAISDYHVGVIAYQATGEGVTVAVAVAPTPEHVEKQLRSLFSSEEAADYFMGGAEIMPTKSYTHLFQMIPQPILNIMQGIPTLEWKHYYHYNLS